MAAPEINDGKALERLQSEFRRFLEDQITQAVISATRYIGVTPDMVIDGELIKGDLMTDNARAKMKLDKRKDIFRADVVRTPQVLGEVARLLHENSGPQRKEVLLMIAGIIRSFMQSGALSITSFGTVWEEILTRIAEGADMSPFVEKPKGAPTNGVAAKSSPAGLRHDVAASVAEAGAVGT